ncbi:MAG: DUF1538 domain-containing protein [Saprospiraceae bacterium]|jgi:hypothetical protein|nr:DUF1538 domain-containing protein [Saprospiraceae bacterium]
MIKIFFDFGNVFYNTITDVAPVVILIGLFQYVILKQSIPNLRKVIIGIIFVILGLTLFLMGLEKALFPIGNIMAEQLSSREFIVASYGDVTSWKAYYWVYIFAALMGFATTIAEPSLIAVSIKANQVSGGSINQWGLRLTVAFGVSIALALGTFRIVSGIPIHYFIIACYFLVIILTIFAPKELVSLAYDVGGVTTSTVTVPIVAALGIGLSSTVPGRNPALDGFGLIAFACLFPIITVLGYATIIELIIKVNKKNKSHEV